MRTVIRKLLVGIAGLVLESLSIPKEQLVAQRQQSAALRRVHQCERVFFMTTANGSTVDIETARQNLNEAKTAFNVLFTEKI